MKLYKDRMSFKRQINKNQAHKITTTAYFVTASDYVIENQSTAFFLNVTTNNRYGFNYVLNCFKYKFKAITKYHANVYRYT